MTSENCCCRNWCCRKRTWLLVAILLLVYFCLVPSRFKPTHETTGLRNPIVKNGKVDYFGAYEATYIDKLVPPEQNGMRDVIAAFGPVVLEQLGMVDKVPWEEIPTNESSKRWFETYWVPLCEHMSIDPYKKPRLYDKRGYYGTMYKSGEGEKSEALWLRLVAAPWKAEDEPEVAAWVADYSPSLDLFGHAVRKPNYVCWRKPNETMFGILLPDVQSTRDFGRSLRVRITERLGRDDVDGAWYDMMSMLYLARHFKKDAILVVDLVGLAMQSEAMKSARLILLHPTINESHLERFAADLESLPPNTLVPNPADCEWFFPHAVNQMLGSGQGSLLISDAFNGCCNTTQPSLLSRILFDWLPIDRNIAGKNLTRLQQAVYGDNWRKTPSLTHGQEYDRKFREQCESFRLGIVWQLLRMPLIRTRSKMVAEMIFRDFMSAYGTVQNAFNLATANDEMLRTAIAILRYKNAHNEYPETLDALVPEFLEIYPLNPFTGRANFVYKREPGELQSGAPTPFRLYAVGADGIVDGGTIKDKAQNDQSRSRVFF